MDSSPPLPQRSLPNVITRKHLFPNKITPPAPEVRPSPACGGSSGTRHEHHTTQTSRFHTRAVGTERWEQQIVLNHSHICLRVLRPFDLRHFPYA